MRVLVCGGVPLRVYAHKTTSTGMHTMLSIPSQEPGVTAVVIPTANTAIRSAGRSVSLGDISSPVPKPSS